MIGIDMTAEIIVEAVDDTKIVVDVMTDSLIGVVATIEIGGVVIEAKDNRKYKIPIEI
jgi:hypothetical protein